jgi:hypothetical protein
MVEIMRSRLFYARAGKMIVLTTFTPLPDGVVSAIIGKAKRALKDTEEELEVQTILTTILEKSQVASREYFGRAWTLAVSRWLPLARLSVSSLFPRSSVSGTHGPLWKGRESQRVALP